MTIPKCQEEILKFGYQFQEHVFINGDTIIKLSKSYSPHAFNNTVPSECDYNMLMWGKFNRDTAWNMACEYVINLEAAKN